MMKEGIVIFLEQEDGLESTFRESTFRERTKAYMADVIICGDKVVKNRWGKHGTIGEPYLEQHTEHTHQMVLDIWDKVMQREKEIKEVK